MEKQDSGDSRSNQPGRPEHCQASVGNAMQTKNEMNVLNASPNSSLDDVLPSSCKDETTRKSYDYDTDEPATPMPVPDVFPRGKWWADQSDTDEENSPTTDETTISTPSSKEVIWVVPPKTAQELHDDRASRKQRKRNAIKKEPSISSYELFDKIQWVVPPKQGLEEYNARIAFEKRMGIPTASPLHPAFHRDYWCFKPMIEGRCFKMIIEGRSGAGAPRGGPGARRQ